MPDDPPSIYRKPSTPGVSDLGVYADKVCDAVEGLNLSDNLSVLVGAMIAGRTGVQARAGRGPDEHPDRGADAAGAIR